MNRQTLDLLVSFVELKNNAYLKTPPKLVPLEKPDSKFNIMEKQTPLTIAE